MNLTLSVQEDVVERARDAARAQGKSLNALIREFLEHLAGDWTREDVVREIVALLTDSPGDSRGQRFRRDELYEERLGRGPARR